MKSMLTPLTLLIVFSAPAVFAAEDVYRSTMPDGRVVYGESPFPGAKSVRKIPAPPVSTGVTYATPDEKSRGAPGPVYAPSPGGVAVIPAPDRGSPEASQQGRLVSPPGLPKRAY